MAGVLCPTPGVHLTLRLGVGGGGGKPAGMLPLVPQGPLHPALSGTPGLPPGDVGLSARPGGACARPFLSAPLRPSFWRAPPLLLKGGLSPSLKIISSLRKLQRALGLALLPAPSLVLEAGSFVAW